MNARLPMGFESACEGHSHRGPDGHRRYGGIEQDGA